MCVYAIIQTEVYYLICTSIKYLYIHKYLFFNLIYMSIYIHIYNYTCIDLYITNCFTGHILRDSMYTKNL